MAVFKTIYDAVDAAVQTYGLPAGGPPIAAAARVLVDKSGNVVHAADDILGTGAAASQLVTASTPLTGTSLSVNTAKQDETLDIAPAGTIATLTIVFPSATASRLNQEIRIVSSQTVTALTLTTAGLTMYGSAVTALAANVPVIFKKIKSAAYARII